MYFVFSLDFHLQNNLPILINITFFTMSFAPAGNLIFFLHIAPNLILYGRGHLPPICDDDWDIVSNLKSGSMFECFPCFREFRWEPIRIMFCHIDNVERHLIATSLPPIFVCYWRHSQVLSRMDQIVQAGGPRSHLAQDCEPTN
jgi:hypothetical protein